MSGAELLGRYFSLLDEDEILELYKGNYYRRSGSTQMKAHKKPRPRI